MSGGDMGHSGNDDFITLRDSELHEGEMESGGTA